MPQAGYRRRYFDLDFKKRAVYELLNKVKTRSALANEIGKNGRLLLKRWATDLKDQVLPPIDTKSYEQVPVQMPNREDELLREIGRLEVENTNLRKLLGNVHPIGRRSTDKPAQSA